MCGVEDVRVEADERLAVGAVGRGVGGDVEGEVGGMEQGDAVGVGGGVWKSSDCALVDVVDMVAVGVGSLCI